MAEDHPNVLLFRRMFHAFGAGDLDGVASCFADGVVWHAAGTNPLSGTYSGRQAVFGFFGAEFERSGGTYSVTVLDVLADDGHIVARTQASAHRDGKALDQIYAMIFHVDQGVIAEVWPIATDQSAVDEFWQ
jgi:ketosteroid isomerase-like protein